MNKKKSLVIISLCGLLVVSIFLSTTIFGAKAYRKNKIMNIASTTFPITEAIDSFETKYTFPSKLFDTSDKEKMVGFVDYVFVAKVNELIGTEYKDLYYNEDSEIVGTPFTKYNITVLKNIKGNLELNKQISLSKRGGITIDNSYIVLDYGDTLPQKDNVYIFLAYADKNGELFVSDDQGNVLIKRASDNSTNNITTFSSNDMVQMSGDAIDLIETYENAYKNQDLSERIGERYSCKHDLS